jgi:hypothetical protein
MTTNLRNQNRQTQWALTNRKNQEVNNKKQAIIKTTHIKINRKVKDQNNKIQSQKSMGSTSETVKHIMVNLKTSVSEACSVCIISIVVGSEFITVMPIPFWQAG